MFADYLEENGDPDRAEFIHAQIQLAKTPEYEPFAVLCKTRRRDWLTGEPWHSEILRLSPLFTGHFPLPAFHRGFLSRVGINTLLSGGVVGFILGSQPIQELHLGTATLDQWREFASQQWLSRIRSLAFTGLSSPNEPLRCLRESPYTTGVTSLRLEYTNVASIGFIIGELFATPLGKQLTSLAMRLGYGHTDETLEAIAENGPNRLVDLDLYRMGFGPAAARVFVDTGLIGQTEVASAHRQSAHASGDGHPRHRRRSAPCSRPHRNDARHDFDRTACPVHDVRRLRKLWLTENKIGPEGIKLLARSPHLAGLRSLGLENTGCDNAGVRFLTRGTFWPNLVELDLRRNLISEPGAKHLLTARPAPDLTSLVLPTRNLTDRMRAELTAKFGDVLSWAE